MEYICRFCGKICKNNNSLKQHEIRCKMNPNKIDVVSNFIGYNEYRKQNNMPGQNQFTKAKRLGLETPKISDETKKKISLKKSNSKHSNESIEKIKQGMKLAVIKYPESYSSQNVNGRVKKISYDDIILDSNWELLVAKYLDEHNIKWERPNKGIPYIWNEDEHIYFPDFYLPDYDYYIEVKGYQRDRDIYKWANVKKLIIIKHKEINMIKNNEFNILEKINSK